MFQHLRKFPIEARLSRALKPREEPKQDGAIHPLVPMKSLTASGAQQ
jgi:hypothetical protein